MPDPKQPRRRDDAAKPDLKEDELVSKLVPDPSQQEAFVVLSGFLGRSSSQGFQRLYTSLQFDVFVEIPEDAIVHRLALTPDQSEYGGTTVWLRAGTQITFTRTTSTQLQAEFLQGSIMNSSNAQTIGLSPAMFTRLSGRSRYNSVDICLSDACSVDVCSMIHQHCPRPTIGNCAPTNVCFSVFCG